MHACLVTETYPPEINGVALTVQALATGLASGGHQVELVRPRQTKPLDETGIAVTTVRGLPLPRYPGLQLGLPSRHRLQRQWRRQRPDVIYLATEGPLGWSALQAARHLKIPVISGFHTRFDTYASHYGLGWLRPTVGAYLRAFHRRTKATLVPTMCLAREIEEMGIDNARLMQRAVDTRLFDPQRRDHSLRASWGASGETVVVLFVGRIAPEKNLDLAIRSWQAIRAAQPDSRCVWVGDGPSRQALQQTHSDIHFTGTLRGEDLARHYASADLFPFPSQSETFGNVVLEAMAAGLAVVAYDQAAAHEHIVNQHNGCTVSPGDSDAFIRRSIELSLASGLRRELAQQAHLSVAHLAPQRVIAEFASILESVSHEPDHAVPAPAAAG